MVDTVRFAVPRRVDHGHRDRLWTFCKQWWTERTGWPVVEGHHDEGPFNRAHAINRAAAGDWDVLIVADSDVIADIEQVTKAVEHAAATGRCTLAYDRYVAINRQITDKILDGYDGDWSHKPELTMTTHVSSLVVIPRNLWDETGGFDERFVGWGYEDVAFIETCRTLGGGIDRIPGTVWHLSHPTSPERTLASPLLKAAEALAHRYHHTTSPEQMRALLDERAEPDGVCAVVMTDGRRECIEQTIPSALRALAGLPIVRHIIHDDSGDRDYQAWLRVTFDGWELVATPKRRGYTHAVRSARAAALQSGQRWIFWLEDDFLFERPVDLAAMARVLDTHPHIMQMALRRQAWFPNELAAGGVIERHPDAYTDHTDGPDRWLEHQRFWTMNPHLVARTTLAAYEWPTTTHSETAFGRRILRDGRVSGYWGPRTDSPWVTHIGQRQGTGY